MNRRLDSNCSHLVQVLKQQYKFFLINVFSQIESNKDLKIYNLHVPLQKLLFYFALEHSLISLRLFLRKELFGLISAQFALWHQSAQHRTGLQYPHFGLLKNFLDVLLTYLVEG